MRPQPRYALASVFRRLFSCPSPPARLSVGHNFSPQCGQNLNAFLGNSNPPNIGTVDLQVQYGSLPTWKPPTGTSPTYEYGLLQILQNGLVLLNSFISNPFPPGVLRGVYQLQMVDNRVHIVNL